jgi:hypothetical protein
MNGKRQNNQLTLAFHACRFAPVGGSAESAQDFVGGCTGDQQRGRTGHRYVVERRPWGRSDVRRRDSSKSISKDCDTHSTNGEPKANPGECCSAILPHQVWSEQRAWLPRDPLPERAHIRPDLGCRSHGRSVLNRGFSFGVYGSSERNLNLLRLCGDMCATIPLPAGFRVFLADGLFFAEADHCQLVAGYSRLSQKCLYRPCAPVSQCEVEFS